MTPLVWPFIGYALVHAQALASTPNVGTRWNGLGCVDDVLARRAMAPMAYRVFVPILLAPVPRSQRRGVYDLILWALASLMLWTVAACHGAVAALALAALLPLTFRYDYWCWTVEIAAMAALTAGRLELAVPWTVAWALSREIAVIAPFVSVCFGGWTTTAFAVLWAMALPTMAVSAWQGRRKLYCDRVMLRRNLREALDVYRSRFTARESLPLLDDGMASVFLSVASIAMILMMPIRQAAPFAVILVAGWVLAVAREARVFAACLLPIACAIAKEIS